MSRKQRREQARKDPATAIGTVSIFTDVLNSITSLFTSDTPELASNRRKIERICRCFVLNNEKLEQVMSVLEKCMDEGLSKEAGDQSTLKMLPTYVRAVPNGEESGEFLALDLGGTHFRVLFIKLNGREAEMTGKVYHVPESLRTGSGTNVLCALVASYRSLALAANLTYPAHSCRPLNPLFPFFNV
ncbi:Hexokinase [Oesophagostomum dentatum]|uniref:Phosphotransferase n=1 Tax=Oesophagostomum dentatum TaxID=61180 RepID=A0A0B1TPL4_OESDE|nr:Hexokinase [Oesophagostomum dentatum]